MSADLSGTQCSAWSNNACCGRVTAENHQLDQTHLEALYGAEFTYAKCGTVSDTCARWFLAESCLYECDVNIGRYRAHPGEAGCSDDGNEWMIQDMPLKVSTQRSGSLLAPVWLALFLSCVLSNSKNFKLGVAFGSEIIPFEPETDNSGEGKLCCRRYVQGSNRLR